MDVDRYRHVVRDPKPGQVIEVPVGALLEIRMSRRSLGLSEWRVDDRPAHLLPLAGGSHDFKFMAFCPPRSEASHPLRMVRHRPHRRDAEVCDLVVQVTA